MNVNISLSCCVAAAKTFSTSSFEGTYLTNSSSGKGLTACQGLPLSSDLCQFQRALSVRIRLFGRFGTATGHDAVAKGTRHAQGNVIHSAVLQAAVFPDVAGDYSHECFFFSLRVLEAMRSSQSAMYWLQASEYIKQGCPAIAGACLIANSHIFASWSVRKRFLRITPPTLTLASYRLHVFISILLIAIIAVPSLFCVVQDFHRVETGTF